MSPEFPKVKPGFSLIEVLVAVAILTLGIATISSLMVSNIRNAQESKDEIVATGLAQEGVELVRNIKDSSSGSLSGVPNNLDDSIDYTSPTLTNNTSPASKELYLDANNFYSHHSSGSATKFYRKIIIQGPNGSKTVTSVVSWNSAAAFTFSSVNTPFPFPPGGDVSNCTIANKCISIISAMPDSK